jgi:hypothetical protein
MGFRHNIVAGLDDKVKEHMTEKGQIAFEKHIMQNGEIYLDFRQP